MASRLSLLCLTHTHTHRSTHRHRQTHNALHLCNASLCVRVHCGTFCLAPHHRIGGREKSSKCSVSQFREEEEREGSVQCHHLTFSRRQWYLSKACYVFLMFNASESVKREAHTHKVRHTDIHRHTQTEAIIWVVAASLLSERPPSCPLFGSNHS